MTTEIINGKKYDTETATVVVQEPNVSLYKTAKGAYFLHGSKKVHDDVVMQELHSEQVRLGKVQQYATSSAERQIAMEEYKMLDAKKASYVFGRAIFPIPEADARLIAERYLSVWCFEQAFGKVEEA